MLVRIADYHGVHHAETLTGFKWIVRPGLADRSRRFVFGYEEALGYAVGHAVRDQDGITAALPIVELAASAPPASHTVSALPDALRMYG